MYRLHCLVKARPRDNNDDREFAGTLRDRDDIDVLPRDRCKDTSGQARCALHTLAHNSKQAHLRIYLYRLQVVMLEFELELGFECVKSCFNSSLRIRKQKFWR